VPAELAVAERMPGSLADAMKAVAARGLEGLIAKREGSTYVGKRSSDWLKLKVWNSEEVAIIGFLPMKNHDKLVGALLVAVAEKGKLRFAGRIGTGFTTKQRGELWQLLEKDSLDAPPIEVPRTPLATWVKPRHIATAQFSEWTRDGVMRQPSFVGLREDLVPVKRVKLTNPDKVLYPADGITKREVADYYQAVSEPLMRALADRPLSLEHWPNGIDKPSFFRQSITDKDREPWMRIVSTPTSTKRGTAEHLVADSEEALAWLAQRATLAVHMWSSRADSLREPDWVVFDLDPGEGNGIEQTIEIAQALNRLFDQLSLPSLPKTTGKRGLHVLVPLSRGHTHDDALEFAQKIGGAITQALPQATMERSIPKRKGRLYLDCFQNGYGKTIVAPYSPRALPGGTVSAPLRWSEVKEGLDSRQFTMRTMPKRLAEVGDLFGPALGAGARLPRLR
jgi:bifunctional non-homologous end joining protein LigD